MKKIIAFSLALLVGSIMSAQIFSLEQTSCNSIKVVHPYEGYDQYTVLLIEKEQLPNIWSKIERIELHAVEYQFNELDVGVYRVTLISPEGEREVSKAVLMNCEPNEAKPSDTFQVNLFPNPATSQLQIQIPNLKQDLYSYQIFSAQGILMKEGEISEKTETLNIERLPVGMYFLKVVSPEQAISIKKIIIQ
ncbi:MAG: T9SS type A sorting domain-containing protein [Bacteroidota bacterium]